MSKETNAQAAIRRLSESSIGKGALTMTGFVGALAAAVSTGDIKIDIAAGLAAFNAMLATSAGKREAEAFTAIVENLQRHQHLINNKVDVIDFHHLLRRSLDNIKREHQEGKVEAYKRFAVNAAIIDVDAEHKELILHQIEHMTSLHLRCFNMVMQLKEQSKGVQSAKELLKPVMVGTATHDFDTRDLFFRYVAYSLGVSEYVAISLLTQFDNEGLTSECFSVQGTFHLNEMSIEHITLLSHMITDFGESLHQFLISR